MMHILLLDAYKIDISSFDTDYGPTLYAILWIRVWP